MHVDLAFPTLPTYVLLDNDGKLTRNPHDPIIRYSRQVIRYLVQRGDSTRRIALR